MYLCNIVSSSLTKNFKIFESFLHKICLTQQVGERYILLLVFSIYVLSKQYAVKTPSKQDLSFKACILVTHYDS